MRKGVAVAAAAAEPIPVVSHSTSEPGASQDRTDRTGQ
jgi:hypothetical protein